MPEIPTQQLYFGQAEAVPKLPVIEIIRHPESPSSAVNRHRFNPEPQDGLTDPNNTHFLKDEPPSRQELKRLLLSGQSVHFDQNPDQQKPIHIPEGKLEAPNNSVQSLIAEAKRYQATALPDEIFNDKIRNVPIEEINNPKIEMAMTIDGHKVHFQQIVQVNNGDCVLATFLNTVAFLKAAKPGNQFGSLPMETLQARWLMTKLREHHLNVDSPNSHRPFQGLFDPDIINLYGTIFEGAEPPSMQSQNYIRVDGALSRKEAFNDAFDLLDILADTKKYPSGVMQIGAQQHSQTLIRLNNNIHLRIDPAQHPHIDVARFSSPNHMDEYMKASGIVDVLPFEKTVEYLAGLLQNDDSASVYLLQHPVHAGINY